MPDVSAYTRFATDPQIAIAASLLLVALLFLAGAAAFRRLRPWQTYLRGKPILTPNEREFFHRLTRALPTYPIFPQVAMSALMDVDGQLSERRRFAIRRRFAWKIADFIICAPYTLDPLLIIELDDRTHNARQDRQRDAMTNAAGYQTVRFQSKHKPTVAELADLFAKLLPTLKSERPYNSK